MADYPYRVKVTIYSRDRAQPAYEREFTQPAITENGLMGAVRVTRNLGNLALRDCAWIEITIRDGA